MAVAITAAPIGDAVPSALQIIATGLTIGQAYTITGTGGGMTWIVRGGRSIVPSSTQIILADVLTPVNAPITYRVIHDADGVTTAASPVTVTLAADFTLTSLDGLLGVLFRWKNNGDPRSIAMRSSVFEIPGRETPAVRMDVPGSSSGAMVLDCTPGQGAALLTLLRSGGIVVRRTTGAVRDVPAVEILLVTSVDHVLTGVDEERRWSLGFRVVGDPQPDVAVAAVDWDDFDAAYVATLWSAFDTEWSTQTWDQFDAEDWINH